LPDAVFEPAQPPNDMAPQAVPDYYTWVTVYLSQGDYLIPVTVRREKPGSSQPQEAIEALLGWNAPELAFSPLPASTKILSVTQEDDMVVVDFDRETMSGFSGGTLGETLLLQSLVLTLTSIEGVERVQVLVEGEIEEAAFGHADTSRPLEPPQMLNTEQGTPVRESGFIRLWFMDSQALFAVPVSRPFPKDRITPENALLELLKGPQTGSALLSPFPGGTTLRSLSLTGNTCTVDLSREFVDNYAGGSAVERIILLSLVLTLTEFAEISEVVLLVEGEAREALLGHIETSGALVREYPNRFN
jgi:germination protein M